MSQYLFQNNRLCMTKCDFLNLKYSERIEKFYNVYSVIILLFGLGNKEALLFVKKKNNQSVRSVSIFIRKMSLLVTSKS